MFATILFCVFALAVIIQLGYAMLSYSPNPPVPKGVFVAVTNAPDDENAGSRQPPVTIIICAKNEAANLQKNLPSILAQRYNNEDGKPLFEVIVVNDASTDQTANVLQALEKQYDNLWDVAIAPGAERHLQGKKFALSKGIAAATHEYLLLTDADCQPASSEWLKKMVAPLTNEKLISAGYGGYYRTKGLLNAFIRWETVHTFLQYSSYALRGKPYMAVGRNLACKKAALIEAQDNPVWNALPSGDDDLLVSIIADKSNMAIVADTDAFTYSDAKSTWKEWIRQKQRHLSTGKYYKKDVKALLGMYALSHALTWILCIALLFSGLWKMALVLMLVRCVIYWIILSVGAQKLQERNILFLLPLFDFGWMLYNFAFIPYILWKNKKQWT